MLDQILDPMGNFMLSAHDTSEGVPLCANGLSLCQAMPLFQSQTSNVIDAHGAVEDPTSQMESVKFATARACCKDFYVPGSTRLALAFILVLPANYPAEAA